MRDEMNRQPASRSGSCTSIVKLAPGREMERQRHASLPAGAKPRSPTMVHLHQGKENTTTNQIQIHHVFL